MPTIRYKGIDYHCREEESVLDAFLRHGVPMAFSCRSGVCQVCIHKAIAGTIPGEAQKGLDAQRRSEGYFLPCRCRPDVDMEIVPATRTESRAAPAAPVAAGLPADPEMWASLGKGELLSRILDDFYTRVYQDEQLSGFFRSTTKQRSMEKQYLFLRQMFTGEKVFFGDRPRNAHHWMVISDELFDYRARLMAACLRRAGLPEPLVARWLAMEERFRTDIVKSAPRKRVMDGVELPLDGFGDTVLEVGTVCDGCNGEITEGTRVRYHLRLGSTYCPACVEDGRVS